MTRRVWRPAILLIAITMLFSALPVSAAEHTNYSPSEAAAALDWLTDQQSEDGGFPGFEGESDPGATADAAVALAALGVQNDEALSYLEATVDSYAGSQAGAAKLALAAHATGADPRDFGGEDLIALLQERADPESGWYDEQLFIHSIVMLALTAAGEELTGEAIDRLIDQQIEEGSWAFTGETEPGTGDTNTTAVALQALAAAGESDPQAVDAGLNYLLDAQLEDGSIVYAIGAEDPPFGDSNSTALAIQGMLAAGLQPGDQAVSAALDALLSFQSESGAFAYRHDMPEDNALSTAQALPALALKTLPVDQYPVFAEDPQFLLENAYSTAEEGDSDHCDYFEITGHNVCNGFRDHWNANGGLAIFGYPMTEEFDTLDDSGQRMTIQYFERARFEYVPLAPVDERLQVAPLGVQTLEQTDVTEILDIPGPCSIPDDAEYSVCGPFLDYWNDFGGEEIFGQPLSDAFGSDGMMVQIFEHARFENQPGEWPERHDVLLGRIGAEVLREQLE